MDTQCLKVFPTQRSYQTTQGEEKVRTNHVSKLSPKTWRSNADVLSRLVRVETVLPTLATKSDLLAMKIELKSEFHKAQTTWRSELQGGHSSLRSELHGVHSALRSELHDSHSALTAKFHEGYSRLSADLHAWRLESKTEMLSLRADMSGLESRLIRWMAGLGIAGLAMFFSFMNLHLSKIEAKLQPYVAVAPAAAGTGATVQAPGGFSSNR